MKNYHEIPLHSSNNEQVLASKHRVPCQGAGKYRSCWAAGSRRCFCHRSSSRSRSARDKSPSSCVFKPSARNECPEKTDGDFTVLARGVLTHDEQDGAGTACLPVEQLRGRMGRMLGSAPYTPVSLWTLLGLHPPHLAWEEMALSLGKTLWEWGCGAQMLGTSR